MLSCWNLPSAFAAHTPAAQPSLPFLGAQMSPSPGAVCSLREAVRVLGTATASQAGDARWRVGIRGSWQSHGLRPQGAYNNWWISDTSISTSSGWRAYSSRAISDKKREHKGAAARSRGLRSSGLSRPTSGATASASLNGASSTDTANSGSESDSEASGGEGGRGGVAVAGGAGVGAGAAAPAAARPENIVHVELHDEAAASYTAYAMSVIVGRALPDAWDGLKPVHRRILFAMHELGLASKKPHRKCARVVGEVLGKYHPHGDSAVYDALVRMAQDFSLRAPLVDGHGNFGSVDADPPAAMRYTECRLQPLSEALLLADLELDTVPLLTNFDGSTQEPQVLPARLPLLLINGATGIAVGMATHIPPHNLSEVVEALCALIRNPTATVPELMEHITGPDFPTGGEIMGTLSLSQVYSRGRGAITLRGRAEIQPLDAKGTRESIIITELPYTVNKAALVMRVADLANDKKLEGVSDIRDESDREGMRVVVEVKRGFSANVVLNNLYKMTQLQTTFHCNMVALVNGEARTLTLRDFLQEFLDFRCNVIQRRAACQLRTAEARIHAVQGLLIALENMADVVAVIRGAATTAEAQKTLQQRFSLSSSQADGVLAMPLRRLTGLERDKLAQEAGQLEALIADLKDLMASRARVLGVVESEARALESRFRSPRRTRLQPGGDGELSDEDVVANVPAMLLLSEKGYVKRLAPATFGAQTRGTVGKTGTRLRADDSVARVLLCNMHDHILFFSERGVVYAVRAYSLPEASRTALGVPLVQVLPLAPGERVTSVVSVSRFSEAEFLVMLTARGFLKKVWLEGFAGIRRNGRAAIQLEEGDELRWVQRAKPGDHVIIATKTGKVVRYDCDTQLRAMGRGGRGVVGLKLVEGDHVAAMGIVPREMLEGGGAPAPESEEAAEEAAEDSGEEEGEEGEEEVAPPGSEVAETGPCLLMLSECGQGKRVPLGQFRMQRRPGLGNIGCKFMKGDGLASLHVVGASGRGAQEQQVVVGSQAGILNRFRVADISMQSRTARGVKVMRLEENDRVKAVSLVHDVRWPAEGSVGTAEEAEQGTLAGV